MPFTVRRGQSALGFKRGSRAFVAGKAILQREKLQRKRRTPGVRGRARTRSRAARVLFALVSVAKLKARFDFYSGARRTAKREFPRKAREEFRKMRFGK